MMKKFGDMPTGSWFVLNDWVWKKVGGETYMPLNHHPDAMPLMTPRHVVCLPLDGIMVVKETVET